MTCRDVYEMALPLASELPTSTLFEGQALPLLRLCQAELWGLASDLLRTKGSCASPTPVPLLSLEDGLGLPEEFSAICAYFLAAHFCKEDQPSIASTLLARYRTLCEELRQSLSADISQIVDVYAD